MTKTIPITGVSVEKLIGLQEIYMWQVSKEQN